MAQRQFRSDDTAPWTHGFGSGDDGAKTVSSDEDYDGANEGCLGSSGGTSVTLASAGGFSDGDLVLIHQTRGTNAGKWELNKISSGGGGTSLTMENNLINTYTDSGANQAQMVEMKEYSSHTVNNSQTLSAPAWDGSKGGIVAFFINGTSTVTGTIFTTGKGYSGGAGSVNANGIQGEGTEGIGSHALTNNGNGGGSSSGSNSDNGAGGGNGVAGGNGSGQDTATGGIAVGNAGLTIMDFGGGGGGGSNNDGSGSNGSGATGSGFVLLIGKIVTVTGTIILGGNVGVDGGKRAGGGGAGGSCLIKGQDITLGSTLITALGGAGGTGTDSNGGTNAGSGGVGRIHVDYKDSISGTTNPTVDSRQDSTLVDPSTGNFLPFM